MARTIMSIKVGLALPRRDSRGLELKAKVALRASISVEAMHVIACTHGK